MNTPPEDSLVKIRTSEDNQYNYVAINGGYIKLVEDGREVIFIEKDGNLFPAIVEIHVNPV